VSEFILYQIAWIPVLILFNAFFVAAEMALVRVRRTRIDQLAERDNLFAKKVQIYLQDPERFISACQLGITIATLLLGAAGESALAENISEWTRHLGMQASLPESSLKTLALLSFAFAFTLTAYIQTVGGELLPKMLTYSRAETVILFTVYPMHFWCVITSPFLVILQKTTEVVVKLLKIKDPPSIHSVHSEEELKMLVTASHDEGVLEPDEEEMLHSVFDFSDTVASEVMTPRIDLVCVSATATIREFVQEALRWGHSRIPVFEEDMDNIFGMVHIRDGLRAMVEHKENSHVREFTRNILIVPENKNLKDLLTEFKLTKTHMAVVMDEYGGTQGIVTLEDLLEELVGDIADEHEVVEEFIHEEADGTYVLDAKLTLEEANEKLDLEIEDEEFNTIGGHVFGSLGREPVPGDEIESETFVLRVLESDRHRIIKLRLIRKETKELKDAKADSRDQQSSTHSSLKNGNGKKTTEQGMPSVNS